MQFPAGSGYQLRFTIGQHNTENVVLFCDGTTLSYGVTSGGSFGGITSIAFNPVTMAYWRLRRSGANVVAEYGSDGISWTVLGTSTGTPTPTLFSRYRTVIEAGSVANTTFSQPVKFDKYTYTRG